MPELMPDPAWADLWPAPLPGRPWSELRLAEREGRLVVDWHARWPGTPFPLSPAACPVCRPLRAWHDALDAAGHAAEVDLSGRTPGPTTEAVEIGFAVEEALRDHRDLHVLVARELADVWADATGATLTARVERAVYAAAGLPEVWILNLQADRLEVGREPHGDRYAAVRVYGPGERVAPLAFPKLELTVADLLPPGATERERARAQEAGRRRERGRRRGPEPGPGR